MTRTPSDEKVVCLSCGLGNYPTANFCVECGAPLSAHSVSDPFDTIKTTGWAYRESQETPRLIVVVGIWMIFSPVMFGSAYCLLIGLKEALSGRVGIDGFEGLLFYLVFPLLLAAALFISTTILYRTTKSYFAGQKPAARPADDAEEDDADDEDDGGEFEDSDDEEE